MTTILITIAVLGVIGLLIGIMLVKANIAFKVEVDPKEVAIREQLPGNNCGACGFAGCDAMAAAIAKGEAPVNGCPVGGAPVAEKIGEIMGVAAEETEKNVAFVQCGGNCETARKKCEYVGIQTCEAAAAIPGKGDKACQFGCLGFGSCVDACQFDAIHIVNGVAVVDRAKCVACGKCVATCPQKLIKIIPDKAMYAVQCSNPGKGPSVKKDCAVGCIGCTLCTRQCENDACHVVNGVSRLDYEKCIACGKCAEKCPQKTIIKRF